MIRSVSSWSLTETCSASASASSTSRVRTDFSASVADLGVELLAGLALRGQELGEAVLVVVEAVHGVVRAAVDLGGRPRSPAAAPRWRRRGRRAPCRGPAVTCSIRLTWPSRSRRSAVSSSRVSNSLASWANSSSASGSSRSLTAVTVDRDLGVLVGELAGHQRGR